MPYFTLIKQLLLNIGDLKAFDNAYQVIKSSPNKTEEILKKRERSEDYDIIQELEDTLQKKKIKPNEEIKKDPFIKGIVKVWDNFTDYERKILENDKKNLENAGRVLLKVFNVPEELWVEKVYKPINQKLILCALQIRDPYL